jgi:hypothetical protein
MIRGRLATYLGRLSAIDLRTLALFRMWLAGVVIADLVIRAPDLHAFYAEDGILSRADRLRHYGGMYPYSVFDLAGGVTGVAVIFGIIALAALAMFVGYRTRLMTIICIIGVHGHTARNPLVYNGGDQLLLVLLVWSVFLPLAARWSVDAVRDPQVPEAREVSSVASFALLFQAACVFVLSGITKLGDATWRAGEGVYYALTAEFYTTDLAHFLRQADGLLEPLSYGVLAFEAVGAVLVLVPWRQPWLRAAYGAGIMFMNLSFWLCLNVGIFSWAAMAAGLVFMPGEVWDAIDRRLGLSRRMAGARARLTGAARRMPRGERVRLELGRWHRPVLGVLLLVMLYGNAHPSIRNQFPDRLAHLARQPGLYQRSWPMFAPIARDHGWFVIPGRLADRTQVDLWEPGGPVSYTRPALISDDFPSYRWRKLMFILKDKGPQFRPVVARYLCRTWNRTQPPDRRLVQLELVYMREESLADWEIDGPKRVSLLYHRCTDPEGRAIPMKVREVEGD